MNLKVCHIAFFLLSFTFPAWSQDCITPSSPVLTRVSVTPSAPNGKTDLVSLNWVYGSTENIDAFIIYQYSDKDKGYMAFDTIWNKDARSMDYQTGAARQISIRYVVASYRKPLAPGRVGCPSPLSNSIETILCKTQIDTCKSTITLTWNKYSDYPVKVTGYSIYVSLNGGPPVEKYQTAADSDNYVIMDFLPDAQYCFFVRAILENGLYSGSNNSCLAAKMQKPPDWIEMDYIRVNEENDVEISFTTDPASEIRQYILERAGENQPFKSIAVLNGIKDRIAHADRDADVSKAYFYRISAINGCGKAVKISEIFSNMHLMLSSEGEEITLFWNHVNPGNSSTYDYELWLNTGNGYGYEGSAGSDSLFMMNLSDIIYRVSGAEVCFYVIAKRAADINTITGESISSRVCISPEEGITVPNLFTPNNDLKNDLFRPVLAFTPREYHLIITDRPGKILFETRDPMEEWNGSGAGQGIYLWWLKVITPSGKSLSKTGTVTIIR